LFTLDPLSEEVDWTRKEVFVYHQTIVDITPTINQKVTNWKIQLSGDNWGILRILNLATLGWQPNIIFITNSLFS